MAFAEEVRAQERQLGFNFDYVIVCVVGFAADGRARRVIGIDASATPAQTKAQAANRSGYSSAGGAHA